MRETLQFWIHSPSGLVVHWMIPYVIRGHKRSACGIMDVDCGSGRTRPRKARRVTITCDRCRLLLAASEENEHEQKTLFDIFGDRLY